MTVNFDLKQADHSRWPSDTLALVDKHTATLKHTFGPACYSSKRGETFSGITWLGNTSPRIFLPLIHCSKHTIPQSLFVSMIIVKRFKIQKALPVCKGSHWVSQKAKSLRIHLHVGLSIWRALMWQQKAGTGKPAHKRWEAPHWVTCSALFQSQRKVWLAVFFTSLREKRCRQVQTQHIQFH